MAVFQEITDPSTPEAVRGEIAASPSWLEIREVRDATAAKFSAGLHRGEREAILLAEEIQPDFLLIDDRADRTAGRSRSLPVLGTLGVLERADGLNLVADFSRALQRLKESGFFISESLEEMLLRGHKIRHQE